MAYTNPVDFVAGSPLQASELNLMQDNIRYFGGDRAEHRWNIPFDSSIDIPSSNAWWSPNTTEGQALFTSTIATGTVLITIGGSWLSTASRQFAIRVLIDGSPVGSTNYGLTFINLSLTAKGHNGSVQYLATGLSQSSHTFQLQFRSLSSGLSVPFDDADGFATYSVIEV